MSLDVTVVGSGAMGTGIAQACAAGGLDVTLYDVLPGAAESAKSHILEAWIKQVNQGSLASAQAYAAAKRIHTTKTLEAAVEQAGLVIEAVFEDLDVKRGLFHDMDIAAPPNTILATNTSSFRVSDMADATDRQDKVLGLHFFFPAHVNPLVEVVSPEGTDEAADVADAAMALVGKVPIRTGDSHGFCVNRFLLATGAEAFRIHAEGVATPATIEAAAKDLFQAPFGPYGVYNLSGPVVTTHALETLHGAFGDFYAPTDEVLAHAERGEVFDVAGDVDKTALPEVRARLRGACIGVACHLVEEGVATEKDTDKGARVGLRWTHGPFAMLDQDPGAIAAEVSALHERWGDAFPMPQRFA